VHKSQRALLRERHRWFRSRCFKRGDEVLSMVPGSPLMTVLAVEGLKVRCVDNQNAQYWFDTIMLERYRHSPMPIETSLAGTTRDCHLGLKAA
jgi:hypothetical protein